MGTLSPVLLAQQTAALIRCRHEGMTSWQVPIRLSAGYRQGHCVAMPGDARDCTQLQEKGALAWRSWRTTWLGRIAREKRMAIEPVGRSRAKHLGRACVLNSSHASLFLVSMKGQGCLLGTHRNSRHESTWMEVQSPTSEQRPANETQRQGALIR